MAERALPDLVSRIRVDTKGLEEAAVKANITGDLMQKNFAKSGAATEGFIQRIGKASGLLGAAGGETEQLTGKLGLLGSLGLNPVTAAALGAAAAIGVLVLAGKSALDITRREEEAERGLAQAYKVSGANVKESNSFLEQFLATNRRYYGSQVDVTNAYAALIRSGESQTKVQRDLNLALDLSAIKHISLEDATNVLIQAENGRARGLATLGINVKAYTAATEAQARAAKDVTAAEEAHQKAVDELAKAQRALKEFEDGLSEKHKKTKLDADHLADAHNRVKDATQAVMAATQRLKAAHDALHPAVNQTDKMMADLQKRLKGGRETTDELTQAHNNLSNTWEKIAVRVGPLLEKGIAAMVNQLNQLLDSVNLLIDGMTRFVELVGKASSAAGSFAHGAISDVSGALSHLPGRQFGGPVVPGQVYRVGEAGPETFVPKVPGTIVPNGQAVASGGNFTLNFNAAGMSAWDVQREIAWMMKQGLR